MRKPPKEKPPIRQIFTDFLDRNIFAAENTEKDEGKTGTGTFWHQPGCTCPRFWDWRFFLEILLASAGRQEYNGESSEFGERSRT